MYKKKQMPFKASKQVCKQAASKNKKQNYKQMKNMQIKKILQFRAKKQTAKTKTYNRLSLF